MSMKKLLMIFAALAMPLLVCACELFEDKERAEAEKAIEAALREKAAIEADRAGRALTAGLAELFVPTAEERFVLDAAPAVNQQATANGIFTNSQGVAGYFQGFEKPFNFIWTGDAISREAFDGRTYRLMNGPGQMLLKYLDEDLLTQRYEGETNQGLLDGFGELWSRNNDLPDGHHYYSYRGELRHDQMEGRGAVSDYDFQGDGTHPYRFEGELRNNLFYGHGRAYDLATGRMIGKGLWLAGQPFPGSEEEWKLADGENERENVDFAYGRVLMTDSLIVGGLNNDDSRELIIIPPPDAERLLLTDSRGRQYFFSQLEHPALRDEQGQAIDGVTVQGVRADWPASDYPLTLDFSYQRLGRDHCLRLTVLRPFILVLAGDDSAQGPEGTEEAAEHQPAQGPG